MKFKLNIYKLKEGREMKADTFSKLVATTLYEHRYVDELKKIKYLVNPPYHFLISIIDLAHTSSLQSLLVWIRLVTLNTSQLFAPTTLLDTENTMDSSRLLEQEQSYCMVFVKPFISQILNQSNYLKSFQTVYYQH